MSEPRRSLLDSTRNLLDTALGLLLTRLELMATELEEEKARFLGIVAYGAIAFVLLSLGLVFFSITLTVLFWDEQRLLVLGLFSGIFLCGGAVAMYLVLRNARPAERMLSASVAELKKDRAALHGEEP